MTANKALTLDEIGAAFSGKIKRPRVSPFYTLGMMAVTFVMLLLPLIYAALIAAVVYITYQHAVHNFTPIMGSRIGRTSGRIMLFKLFLYVTPIFIGSVLSFFMVKPFFARRIAKPQPYALNPENEPVLFEFIRKLCETVGAPMPALIALDSDINASAALRRGFRSFFSRDLSLNIGLSLMAGLTAREFAGVIAHEFGHFTQGLAMRLFYIIENINFWFARVIYERDSWDAYLEEMAETEEAYLAFMVGFARLGVWFSRRILTLLMLFGRAISCYLSRQMEYNADQFEIRLAGSQAFESTSNRLTELNALHHVAMREMRVSWNLNKRLPNNLPRFILNKQNSEVGGKVQKLLKEDLGFVKTGLFHTHPSNADRVREARLAQAPGIFKLDAPAASLFQNFDAVAGIVTRLTYQEMEIPIQTANIYEVAPAAEEAQSANVPGEDDRKAAIDRFLFGVVSPLRPIFPRIRSLNETEAADAFRTVQTLPEQLSQVADAVAGASGNFDQADQDLIKAANDGGDLAVPREQREHARHSLHAVLEACEQRLGLALSLSRDPVARGLCNHLNALAPALKEADALRVSVADFLRNPDDAPRLARLEEQIANIEATLRDIPCPWPEGEGSSLLEFFRAVQEGPVSLPEWGQSIAGFTMASYLRFLGEAALLAERLLEQGPPKRAIRVVATH